MGEQIDLSYTGPGHIASILGDPGRISTISVRPKGYTQELGIVLTGDLTISGLLTVGSLVNQSGIGLNAKDYGAVGDGVANDTAALQAWINAGITAGDALWLPRGRYAIDATLTGTQANGLALRGAGGGDNNQSGSQILWRGNNSSPAFYLPDAREVDFRDFTVVCGPSGSGYNPLLAGFKIENVSGGVASHHNYFHHVSVSSTTVGGLLKTGWWHALGSAGDLNNDLAHFDHCSVRNYDNCAWLSQGSQSLQHEFVHCEAYGAPGQIAVSLGNDTHASTIANGGSFTWFAGYVTRNQTADFYQGAPTGTIVIVGVHTELSARFFDMQGPGGGHGPVTIIGVRYDHAGNLAGDKYFIRFRGRGPFKVQDSRFEDALISGSPNAMQILFQPFGSSTIMPQLIVENNLVEGTAANLVDVAPTGSAVPRVIVRNNDQINVNTSVSSQYPDFGNGTYVAAVKTAATYTTKHYLDEILQFDTTSNAITVTLATAVGWAGKKYTIKKVAGGNTLTLTGGGTIDGAANLVITTQATVVSDGTNWIVVG